MKKGRTISLPIIFPIVLFALAIQSSLAFVSSQAALLAYDFLKALQSGSVSPIFLDILLAKNAFSQNFMKLQA